MPYTHVMRRRLLTLLPLLLFATLATAAPQIISISPNVGFSFGGTKITITGTDLMNPAVPCPPPPGSALPGSGTCSVEVYFGDTRGHVSSASLTQLRVVAVPSADFKPVVDVRVVVIGKGEVTVPNGFRFDPLAEPGPENYTQYLLPIYVHRVPGAFGSLWSSEWTVYNNSLSDLQILGGFPLILADPPISWIPPRMTLPVGAQPSHQGAFIYVPNPLVESTTMSLRIRDVSDDAVSFGAELPIVPMRKFVATQMLIDVPNQPHYRATLRIYGAGAAPQTVGVKVFDPDFPNPISEFTVLMEGIVNVQFDPMPRDPSYAQIDLLTPELRAGNKPLRVEVDNLGANVSPPPPGIWAFISITNNNTQQVTTITPQDK